MPDKKEKEKTGVKGKKAPKVKATVKRKVKKSGGKD